MSLHHLAKHMQSQGRDGDTGLIHMSPGEIGALQKLAIAHGGSLTVNPETGLPEAGFLKDWLPSIVGGLTMLIPGVGIPLAMALAAGTTFGTSMAVGNSLNKSLLQGAAAGAGAGLGGALGGAGAAEVGGVGAMSEKAAGQGITQAGTAVTGQAVAQQAAQKALADQAMKGAVGATQRAAATTGGNMWGNVGSYAGKSIAPMIDDAGQLATKGGFNAAEQSFMGVGTPYASPASFAPKTPPPIGAEVYKAAGPMERLSHMNKGVDRLFNEEGFAGDFASANKGKLLTLGTGVAGNMMMSDPKSRPNYGGSTYAGPYLPTERTAQFPTGPEPWTDTSERQYFDDVNPYPGYAPADETPTMAGGGLIGLAGYNSYDDEAGYDGYAKGGEVAQNNMATPDMSAIQQYVQSISQPQRPQVPEILRQLQASRAATGDTQQPTTGSTQQPTTGSTQQPTTGEHDYGFKPITAQGAVKGKYLDLTGYIYNPETQQMEAPPKLAMGGLTSLAAGGSYLDGPGDGLSDSIPAMIGKNQPARLADGEFVISADVVSAIGGGSSKAGAKKLHAMMDRVRQSAHGTKKQVKKINDRKVLAA